MYVRTIIHAQAILANAEWPLAIISCLGLTIIYSLMDRETDPWMMETTLLERLSERPESMKSQGLDAADIRILSAIQKHGHLSKTKLAEMVNLSPTPCWERLTKLKSAGFIRGYRGVIALDRICDFTQVIVTVSLTHHRKSDFDRFEARIRALDEVTECIATGGGMDYVMKVYSPNLTAFQNLMESLLAAELGIDRYMTYIVTREVKSESPNLSRLTARSEN